MKKGEKSDESEKVKNKKVKGKNDKIREEELEEIVDDEEIDKEKFEEFLSGGIEEIAPNAKVVLESDEFIENLEDDVGRVRVRDDEDNKPANYEIVRADYKTGNVEDERFYHSPVNLSTKDLEVGSEHMERHESFETGIIAPRFERTDIKQTEHPRIDNYVSGAEIEHRRENVFERERRKYKIR